MSDLTIVSFIQEKDGEEVVGVGQHELRYIPRVGETVRINEGLPWTVKAVHHSVRQGGSGFITHHVEVLMVRPPKRAKKKA